MFLCADDLNHKSEINITVFQDVIPRVAIFRRKPLPPSCASSLLKMEVGDFSENLSSSVSVLNILSAVQLCYCTVHDSSCLSVLFYSVFHKLYIVIIIIIIKIDVSSVLRSGTLSLEVCGTPVDRKLSGCCYITTCIEGYSAISTMNQSYRHL